MVPLLLKFTSDALKPISPLKSPQSQGLLWAESCTAPPTGQSASPPSAWCWGCRCPSPARSPRSALPGKCSGVKDVKNDKQGSGRSECWWKYSCLSSWINHHRILMLESSTELTGGHEDFVGEQEVTDAGICSETNITATNNLSLSSEHPET